MSKRHSTDKNTDHELSIALGLVRQGGQIPLPATLPDGVKEQFASGSEIEILSAKMDPSSILFGLKIDPSISASEAAARIKKALAVAGFAGWARPIFAHVFKASTMEKFEAFTARQQRSEPKDLAATEIVRRLLTDHSPEEIEEALEKIFN